MIGTALITGASSGIGKEFAKIHAQKGGNLVLVARRENNLLELQEQLIKEFNIQVEVLSIDLSAEGAAKKVYAFTQEKNIFPLSKTRNFIQTVPKGNIFQTDWQMKP